MVRANEQNRLANHKKNVNAGMIFATVLQASERKVFNQLKGKGE